MRQRLSDKEKAEIKGGEAITLAAVLAIRTIGVRAVVTYKLFFPKKERVFYREASPFRGSKRNPSQGRAPSSGKGKERRNLFLER